MKLDKFFKKNFMLFSLLSSLLPFHANAADNHDDSSSTYSEEVPSHVQVHGYGTFGYSRFLSQTNENSLGYGVIDKDGTFLYNSILGLNLSYVFNDELTFYTQLTASGSQFYSGAISESYPLNFDIAMLNYHPYDWLNIRVGRQVMPVWMTSEQIDMGVTYPWIRPPMEVYALAPVKSATGLGIDFKNKFSNGIRTLAGIRLGDGTYNESTQFSGTVHLKHIYAAYAELNYKNLLKLRTSVGGLNSEGLAYGVNISKTNPNNTITGTNTFDNTFEFYSFGGTINWNNFLFMGEFANSKQITNANKATTNDYLYVGSTGGAFVFKAWYATVAYHLNDWTPHLTYSQVTRSIINMNYDDIQNAFSSTIANTIISGIKYKIDNNAIVQRITLGLNYDFTNSLVGKFQFEQIRTNDSPFIKILTGPTIANNDIINMPEVAVSFIF